MTGRDELVALCRAHGIDEGYWAIDGRFYETPTDSLAAIAAALRIRDAEPTHMATIAETLEHGGDAAHVPAALRDARAWGVACQLGSLVSSRNHGMGDFADLAELCRIVGGMGADFVGLNPLHALFSSNPAHASPFSPSNRLMWNPLYLAPDWIEGWEALPPDARAVPDELRTGGLVDLDAVTAHKRRVVGALFDAYPWTPELRRDFETYLRRGDGALEAHALFETLSRRFATQGLGSGWMGWPDSYRDRNSVDVRAYEAAERDEIEYYCWLQWQTDRQLARAAQASRDAGMRVGLYLDLAVGAVPDGSATWTDPSTTVPGLHIGAPPDPFSASGQDWGLAPINPVALAATNSRAIADMLTVAMRHAGAVRIDHAMGLARLWMIPAGRPALEGAYVRYPLDRTLEALAGCSNRNGCIVIGEDLGVVPDGFRPLMEQRDLHAYKVFFFERDEHGFRDPSGWGRAALACVGTHDTPSFPGWWTGHDIEMRRSIGLLDDDAANGERWLRGEDRERVRAMIGEADDVETSVRVHAHVARSPCRLMVAQLDDMLGTLEQPNLPGTIDEHPNWRRRMSVPLEMLDGHEGLARHIEALRRERPRAAS